MRRFHKRTRAREGRSLLHTDHKPEKPIKARPLTSHTIMSAWREAYAKCYPDEFQTPWTGKQYGQVNHLIKILPPAKVEPVAVVVNSIEHWINFVIAVSNEMGYSTKSLPRRPTLDFLLPNIAVAVNFMAQAAPPGGPSTSNKPKPFVIVKKSKPAKTDIAGLSDILDQAD